jgi:hypothetical protein
MKLKAVKYGTSDESFNTSVSKYRAPEDPEQGQQANC